MRLGVWIIYILFSYCRLVKKSFIENLGMGEWAPLPPSPSSATPSRIYAHGGDARALYSATLMTRRSVILMTSESVTLGQ